MLHKSKKYKEAEREYRKAIKINPNYEDAHNGLGVLLYNLKKYEEAQTEFRDVLMINPNNAEANNNLKFLLNEEEKKHRIY